MIVDDRVLLELKAQERLPKACELQILNYRKAGGIRVGMLINFAAPRATIRRMVLGPYRIARSPRAMHFMAQHRAVA